jgi:hypothetical protein
LSRVDGRAQIKEKIWENGKESNVSVHIRNGSPNDAGMPFFNFYLHSNIYVLPLSENGITAYGTPPTLTAA